MRRNVLPNRHPIRTSNVPTPNASTSAGPMSMVPTSTVTVRDIPRNGNCFFTAIETVLRESGADVAPGSLRNQLAQYIRDNGTELRNNASLQATLQKDSPYDAAPVAPIFRPADIARDIEQDGHWNSTEVDIAVALAGQVLGREIRILNPIEGNNQEYQQQGTGVIPAYTDTLPGPDKRPATGAQAPIYLLHVAGGTHFDLLEPRAGQPSPTKESAAYTKESAAYTAFIQDELLAGKPIEKASPERLEKALIHLESVFDNYEDALTRVDSGKDKGKQSPTQSYHMAPNSSDTVEQAKSKKHEIEDRLSGNSHKRFGIKSRKGRQEALKAINLIGGRIALELQQRNQQRVAGSSASNQQSTDLLERVTKKLRQPSCQHDAKKLAEDLSALPTVSAPSGRRVTWADRAEDAGGDQQLIAVTKRYNPFIDTELLNGKTLETASQREVRDGIERFAELVDQYSSDTRRIDRENDKGSRLKDKHLLNTLQHSKHSIEDSLGDEKVKHTLDVELDKRTGARPTDERQEALKDMHLIHSRLDLELHKRKDRVGNDPAISQQSSELMAKLAHNLDEPGFRFSVDQLKLDINEQLIRKEVGVEKLALMQNYVGDMAGTLNMLSSEANAEGVGRKAWQSPEVDKIVGQVQSQVDKLNQSLKPTFSDLELAEAGIKTNQILERGYSKIAKHVQTQLKRASKHSTAISDLKLLRDTSLHAAQHHKTSHQLGMIAKVEHEFNISLTQHSTARSSSGTAPGPSINRSSTTRGVAGVKAGIDIIRSRATNENGEPINQLGASVSGSLTGQHTRSATLARANNGRLLLKNVAKNSGRVSGEASAGFTSRAVEEAVGQLPAIAKINGSGTVSRQTGASALTSSSDESFRALHASKLTKGHKISGQGLGGARLFGIDDAYGTGRLAGISQESLKLGYNNDHEVAAGFQTLLGPGHTTGYDHSGKGPLADMFTSMSLDAKPAAQGQPQKGVMSTLLPDPIWESKDVRSTTWKGNVFGQVNTPNRIVEHVTGFFPINPGIKAGLSGSVSVESDSRTARASTLPHDVFNPEVTLSSRTATENAKDYFSNPTAANLTLSKPIAEALGFDNTTDYFRSVAHVLEDEGLPIGPVDSERLTQSYKTLESDVNIIDQFFIQPENSLRERQLPKLQAAIQRINQDYGAQLPLIDKSNMGDFTATNRKGKTQSYQNFQDTAVTIMSSFSAAGGAMKLLASQSDRIPAQKASLEEASTSLLSSIENRSMPWSKMEMVNRGTYVQQVVAEPLSRSVKTELTGELATFDGNNDVTGHMEFDDGGVNKSSYPGVGVKVTKTTTQTTRDDNVIEPGQTGTTRDTVIASRKLNLLAQALISPKDTYSPPGIKEKLKGPAKILLGLKNDSQFNETVSRTQAYTARPDEKPAREFLAYKSKGSRSDYEVRGTFGGAIPAGPVSVLLGASHARSKSDYDLESFTYGNDVGAMSMVGEQLFADHKINIKEVAAQIEASQQAAGPAFEFLDGLDDRFSDAILGNDHYDHMSAILSKFRNAGLVETTKDGETSLQAPTLTDDSHAIPAPSVGLHDSKGEPLDLTAGKTYVERSGFLGYAIARYDENLIQDASKHWAAKHDVSFPAIAEIDALLSKKAPIPHSSTEGSPTDQTRQQWLKSASKKERKDFYQNNPDGQKMTLNYLKVLSFSASLNDVIFQNNTLQMMHDQTQIDRVDRLFAAREKPTFKKETLEI